MTWNLYRHEIRRLMRSTIGWSLAGVILPVLYFAFYPVFADQAAVLEEALRQMPPAFLEAFNIRQDFATVLGFYAMIWSLQSLVVGMQAAIYGFGQVAPEEALQTADFLLSKPIGRAQVLTGKLLAALTVLTITLAVNVAATWGAVLAFHGQHPFDARRLWLLLLTLAPIQWFFLGVGLFLSLWIKRLSNPVPYGLGLAVALYVLGGLSELQGTAVLEVLSPFKHFAPFFIIDHGHYNGPLVALDLAITLLAVAATYALYRRRDIASVV